MNRMVFGIAELGVSWMRAFLGRLVLVYANLVVRPLSVAFEVVAGSLGLSLLLAALTFILWGDYANLIQGILLSEMEQFHLSSLLLESRCTPPLS